MIFYKMPAYKLHREIVLYSPAGNRTIRSTRSALPFSPHPKTSLLPMGRQRNHSFSMRKQGRRKSNAPFVREWGVAASGRKGLVVEGVGEEGAVAAKGDNSEGDTGREEQPGGGLGGDADRVGDGAEDVLRGGIGAALDLKEAG